MSITIDLRPNRKYPNIPSITDDPKSHTDALRAIVEALNIGQRRTSDVLSSFIRVSDLVDVGVIDLEGSSATSGGGGGAYAAAVHTHSLSDVTDEGALAYLSTVGTAQINADAVTNTILANMAQATVKGRAVGAGTGDPVDLTDVQLAAILAALADPIPQYVLAAGDTMLGTLNTRALTPTADITYDLGLLTARYVGLYGTNLRVIGGDAPTSVTYVAPIHQMMTVSNAGTVGLDIRAGGQQSVGIGYVKAVASSTANFTSRSGAFVACVVDASGTGTALAQALGASFVGGRVASSAANVATIGTTLAGVNGAFCFASVAAQHATYNAVASAAASGAFVNGSVSTGPAAGALLQVTGAGGFAQGSIVRGGTIETTNSGGFAQGYAQDGATLSSQGFGSFAQGASYGDIIAGGYGSFAQGYSLPGYRIYASGQGAMAAGFADTADIDATADGAIQLGKGVNALADSMQIGSAGIRFKGTVAAPGTPQNGDHWMAGTGDDFLIIQSNGKPVQINTGEAGWTTGAHATLRDFTGTTTAAQALQLLETLIEELKAANLIN